MAQGGGNSSGTGGPTFSVVGKNWDDILGVSDSTVRPHSPGFQLWEDKSS